MDRCRTLAAAGNNKVPGVEVDIPAAAVDIQAVVEDNTPGIPDNPQVVPSLHSSSHYQD
jgi:hypothetical protein